MGGFMDLVQSAWTSEEISEKIFFWGIKRKKKVKKTQLSSEKNFQRNSLHVSPRRVNNFKYVETTE